MKNREIYNNSNKKNDSLPITDSNEQKEEQKAAADYDHMSHKQQRHYRFQQEKKKLSEMTFHQKAEYIFMYYKWYFICTAIFIVFAIQIGKTIYVSTLDIAANIAIVNDMLNEDLIAQTEDEYRTYASVSNKKRVIVDNSYKLDTSADISSTSDLAYFNKLTSGFLDGSIDVLISDQQVVDYYAEDGYVSELKANLPDDIYELVKDDLYYYDGPSKDSDYYAINITNTPYVKNHTIHYDTVYLSLPALSEHREAIYSFIRYVYGVPQGK